MVLKIDTTERQIRYFTGVKKVRRRNGPPSRRPQEADDFVPPPLPRSPRARLKTSACFGLADSFFFTPLKYFIYKPRTLFTSYLK